MRHLFKQLLAGTFALAGATIQAAEWKVPVPAASEPESGSVYYLYNVGYSMFVNQGEAWDTQAIVSKQGMAAKVDNIADGVYTITFLKTSKGDNRQYFRTSTDDKIGKGVKAAFVDGNGKGTDVTYWSVTASGNGNYTIGLPTDNSAYTDGEALGVDTLHAGAVSPTFGTYWDIPAGKDNTIWRFISETDYQNYFTALETYDEAMRLAEEIEKAKADGLDVSEAEAVYANTSSTIEEIRNAINNLYLQRTANASVGNPVDLTGKIVNPNFDDGINGWISTTGAKSNKTATNQQGDFIPPFYENWNPKETPLKGKIYQKLAGLPEGVYQMKAAVSAQSQATALCEEGTFFYGNSIITAVKSVEPIFMQAFVPVNADSLELGLLMNDNNKNNWVAIDNVSLVYYGNSIESYRHMATLFDNWKEAIDGMTVTQSIVNMVDDELAKLSSAADADAAVAAYKKAVDGVNDAYANAAAYEKLIAALDYAEYDAGLDYAPLNEWIEQCHTMLDEATASTEEIIAAVERIYSLIEEGRRNQLQPGDNATSLLVNPDFTESAADVPYSGFGNWNITGTNNFASNGKPNTSNGVAEVWVNAFELSQTVSGLQNGVYKLSTKAFYRYPEKNADPYAAYVNGEVVDVEVASLFANDGEQGIPNVFSGRQTASLGSNEKIDADGGHTPNDKATAAKYFEAGLYQTDVYGVVTDGTLTVGIHGKNDNHWVLWSPFTLVFEGKDATVLADVLQKAIAESGLLETKKQGKDVKSALSEALAAARNAVNGTDGEAMFNAYVALNKATAESRTSISAYAALEQANSLLANTIDLYQDDADTAILNDAIALNSSVNTELNNGSLSNDEAMGKIKTVNRTIIILKASAASDDNAVDMTDLIVNPDFVNNNTDGWTVEKMDAVCGVQNTVFEGYNGNFDICQIIEGAPEGTYKVSVNGFYRRGSSDNANSCYLNDSTIIGASLYGNGADSVQLRDIVYVDPIATSAGEGSWKFITVNEEKFFYPNDRATARNRFDNMIYENELFTNVGADGILKIGVRNTNKAKEDWTAMSNFRLTYYGANSSHASATGISGIGADTDRKVEIFTIDGVRVNAPVKGLNIIKTTIGGKTTVRKVVCRK